jgi:V/A-type H+-transporting ATPase subunit F
MTKYNSIAVIGRSHDILGFKAAGLNVFAVSEGKEARTTLLRIADRGYAVIFITEDIAEEVKETMQRFKTKTYPAIIPIPTAKGSTGVGIKGIMQDADKVIGADILFRQ